MKISYLVTVLFLISCGGESKQVTDVEINANKSESTQTTEVKNDDDKKKILCFGDSITAGYGLDDLNDAYPMVLQSKIDSLELGYTVINSGVSGETTAGGRSRINWVIKQDFDVFLLELGANDGLRGIPLSETKNNLQAIINAVKEKNPETTIILAGMELPPNMGQEYTSEFRTIFKDVAASNNIELIPFILKDVGGIKSLNQNDGIHPTKEGHKIVAQNVWEVLEPIIQS